MKYREVKIFGGVLLGLVLVMFVIFFGYFDLSLEVKINGGDIVLDVFDTYEDDGVSASFLWKDITNRVKINNNVKNNKLGTYYIWYKVNYLGLSETVKRKVLVVDREAPVIELYGDSSIELYVGDKYSEEGYRALDNYDKNITDKVEVISDVNLNKVGTYFVRYSVKDSSGNEKVRQREVIVKKKKVSVSTRNEGVIYLTFDDGPSSTITSRILDILKEEGVKATFFVVNRDDGLSHLIKREYDEGHTVGIHSYTHDYSLIYQSRDSYFKDLEKMVKKVEGIIGEKSNIIRFPGGSSNTVSKKYKEGIMSELSSEVIEKGYRYFDWNVDSNDAGGAKSKEEIYNNVVSGLSINRENVVLMHDFDDNYITLDALRDIINYGKENGYVFKRISDETEMVVHRVSN